MAALRPSVDRLPATASPRLESRAGRGGHLATIDAYLRDVAKKLGETAEPQHVTA